MVDIFGMVGVRSRTPLRRLMALHMGTVKRSVEDTATGNPLTFLTDLAKPLRSLLIPFTPKQSGTGDPSPSNIRPILPWDGVKVASLDENLLSINRANGQETQGVLYTPIKQDNKTVAVHVEGKRTSNNPFFNLNYVNGTTLAVPVGSYKIYGGVPGCRLQFFYKDENGTERIAGQDFGDGATATVPEGATASWLRLLVDTDDEVDLVVYPVLIGASSTYDSVSIPFPSLVYGGVLDVVSGVLSVEWKEIVKTWGDFGNKTSLGDNTRGTLNISSYPSKPTSGAVDAKCNVAPQNSGWSTDSIHFYTNEGSCIVFLPNDTDESTEIQVVYPLATPQEIQLTPEQITALVGNNTIWSDTNGENTVVFLKKA